MTHNTFMNCKDWSKSDLELLNTFTLGRDANSYPQGGWTPSPEFEGFRTDFTFSEKPLIFLTRWGIL